MKTEILTAIDSRDFIKELAPLLRDELTAITEQKAKELTRAEYLTTSEACTFCGVSRPTLQSMAKETGTRCIKYGSKILYARNDLKQMMNYFYED